MNPALRCVGLLVLLLPFQAMLAQVRVSGRVYDVSQQKPLEAVSVLSTSGGGTLSDRNGRYTIIVSEKDSIWFSYLGKPTPKFPVVSIGNIQNFEVALHVNITELKEVVIMPRNYRRDSLQNRLDYAKAFNFRKPSLESITSLNPASGGAGVGIDLNELIRMFQFNRNRRMEAFRERLLLEEIEKYIDNRFSRPLIIKLTQLRGAELDQFIKRYRPGLEFTESATDYEFQSYIKRCYLQYERYKRFFGDGSRWP